jgi:hypothetical protein
MHITVIHEPPAGREIDGRAIGWGIPDMLDLVRPWRSEWGRLTKGEIKYDKQPQATPHLSGNAVKCHF